ncbi:hypothetical protein QR680_002021 [Steinernema hermaphroditum]|uniref:G-protein coupled receptors family 2 profile 2 domain-containing protein n=1 Tax=Steinernema hermaphroditum TaxID=289476 RepID=A0AA39H0W3_9BILA|nr:hypothetical protein QR680_002021 [Steinernema hermaphroditum]
MVSCLPCWLLFACLPSLVLPISQSSCLCGTGATSNQGEICSIVLEGDIPVSVTGCSCLDNDEVPFVEKLSLDRVTPSTISCRLETTIDPLEDDFFNTTNATTTEIPSTTPYIQFDRDVSLSQRIPVEQTIPPKNEKTTEFIKEQSTKQPSEKPTPPTDETIQPTKEPVKRDTEQPEKDVEQTSEASMDPKRVTAAPNKATQSTPSTSDDFTNEAGRNPIIGGGGIFSANSNESNPENSTEEEIIQESPHRCNNTEILQGDQRKTVRALLYFTTVWVVLWCLITIVCNFCWENGHHRYLNFIQEMAIIMLFIVIGTCSMQSFQEKISCQITSHLIAATVAWLMASFFMEGISANRIVKGRTSRIGWLETIMSTVFPFVVAGAVVGAGVGVAPNVYGYANIHCFCSLETKQFWIFVIPPWILIVLFSFVNQNTIISCDFARDNAHEPHLFWGRKSAKSNTVLPLFIFSAYTSALFGADLQFLWLFVVYTIICIFLGPLIFVLHTYCYLRSSTKLGCSPIYAKCRIKYLCNLPEHKEFAPGNGNGSSEAAEKPKDQVDSGSEDESIENRRPEDHARAESSPYIASRPPTTSNPHQVSTSQNLYDWLSDRNEWNMRQGEDILFRPRVYD